jgi:hypothetical protein
MAEENFDFGLLEGGGDSSSEGDAGASLQDNSEPTNEGVVDEASRKDTHSQPQSSPATESEEYSPRERALLDRIEQLTGRSYENQRVESNPTQFTEQQHNFLDGLDIDEVLSSGENLNKLLLAVYNRGLQESIRMAREGWSNEAPDMVRSHINQHMSMREMVDAFYAANPDLLNARKTVGAIANEVSQENQELTIEQVFAEAAKRTREALGLPPLEERRSSSERPNLPTRRQPGNRRNGTATLTGVAKEIDDLLS